MEKEFNAIKIDVDGEITTLEIKINKGKIMEKEFNLSDKLTPTSDGPLKKFGFIRVDDVKEFIKIIERIIIERKSRRLQLIELKKSAGDKLI